MSGIDNFFASSAKEQFQVFDEKIQLRSNHKPKIGDVEEIVTRIKRRERGVSVFQQIKSGDLSEKLFYTMSEQCYIEIVQGIGCIPALVDCFGVSVGSVNESKDNMITQAHFYAPHEVTLQDLVKLFEQHKGRRISVASAGLNEPTDKLRARGFGGPNGIPVSKNEWDTFILSLGFEEYTIRLRKNTFIDPVKYAKGKCSLDFIIHSTAEISNPQIVSIPMNI